MIPDDINANILTELLESNITIIKKNDNNINQILYIDDYFQLNNVMLRLKYKHPLEYDEKYNIIKKMVYMCRSNFTGVVNMPVNTESFRCIDCRNITGFAGRADEMDFSHTSLSGIIEIPEGTESFSCDGG